MLAINQTALPTGNTSRERKETAFGWNLRMMARG